MLMNTSKPINSTGLSKTELRKQLKDIRNSLSEEEVQVESSAIVDRLKKNVDWSAVSFVHLYLPISINNEVDTWGLLEWIWATYPSVTTSTSVYGESIAIQHAVITSATTFEVDSLGIPTPRTNFEPKSRDYDLIIVPLLGFDGKLNRIGYGRGVYDSFLAKQPKAKRIGLAYENCRVDLIPAEPHDEQLNEIITEQQLYN